MLIVKGEFNSLAPIRSNITAMDNIENELD